jgi:hypothetical protein
MEALLEYVIVVWSPDSSFCGISGCCIHSVQFFSCLWFLFDFVYLFGLIH